MNKKMMKEANGEEEMCVLVDTTLSTRIAMPVTPYMTAADLKRELGEEHFICFPDKGAIKINSLTVKRRSCYYHLPDSIRIKDVFQGRKGTWYLHVNATPSNHFNKDHKSESVAAKVKETPNSDTDVANSQKPENKAKERETEECMLAEGVPKKIQTYIKSPKKQQKRDEEKHCHILKGADQGERSTSPSMSVSEVASVTGLITRYFPEFDEVKSCNSPSSCAEPGIGYPITSHCRRRTPPRIVSLTSTPEKRRRASRRKMKLERTEVGKRILLVANDFRDSASKNSPVAMCQSISRRLSCSVEKTIVFEISDSVD